MTGNSYGDFRTTQARDWRAFDRLPARLRYAVNYAAQPWAAEPILDAWRGGEPVANIIRNMIAEDLEDTARIYGPNHPEAMRV